MATTGKRPTKNGARGKAAPRAVRPPSLIARFFRGLGIFIGFIIMFGLLGGIGVAGYTAYVVQETGKDLPQSDKLIDYTPGGITTIYATDKDPKTGQLVVLGRVYNRYKEFAPIDEIPELMQNATIAIEDERFKQHRGIDFEAIARAIVKNIETRDFSEGASTLTQQLARNIYLTKKKTVSRKLQEILLAILLEKNFSKEQIMEMYLNEVCYGVNTYGVKAAAKVYFGRNLKNLSLSQIALLAGLPQQPARLEPFKHKEAAIKRRNVVLAKMAELGFITQDQCKVAQSNGVFLATTKPQIRTETKAPYFTTYVIQQLKHDYGEDAMNNGGLQVYTTLNYAMQKEAERAIINGVMQAGEMGVTQGAIVSLEPRTGYIRAMVGGVDWDKSQFNSVTQGGRQPGSSFKPIVYATAMAANPNRYGADSEVDNSRRTYGTGKRAYRPTGHGPSGPVSIRTALAWSYNNAAVNTANTIGVQHVIETARKLGITSRLDPTLALALGAYEVTPLEMASAYATFANHGSHAAPMAIIRVVDQEGVMLANNTPRVEQAVLPEYAVASISDALRSVIDFGTAANAAGIHDIQDAHGKTGTTNDNKDAWFVGYTPELSTAVWVCGLHYEKRGKYVVPVYRRMAGQDGEVTGGHVCAPIWARFMKAGIPIQKAAKLPRLTPPEKILEPSPSPTPRYRRRRRRTVTPEETNERTRETRSTPEPAATEAPAKTEQPKAEPPVEAPIEQHVETPPAEKPADTPPPATTEPAPPQTQ